MHNLLDIKVQSWLFKQGWKKLRDIQSESIKPILEAKTDLIISASTAAGKTEAFFLPALSAIIQHDTGIRILYISPLKALINDQYRRLEELSIHTDIHITSWHGDSSVSKKNATIKTPKGVILITPESLESLLMHKSSWILKAFKQLNYIAIDEFHYFIGTERGMHLMSLLHRLEHTLGRLNNPIPRVALSATLGNIAKVPLSLRPNQSLPCKIISDHGGSPNISLQIKGYIEPTALGPITEPEKNATIYQISQDIYEKCRGKNHLVFANSRNYTEIYSAKLRDLCNKNHVPNEFFPHHGSLSKEIREQLENRLQSQNYNTTAICTSTLELGIDIGKVSSVVQLSSPSTVSSLRQRIGRSGRRGGPAVLRMLIKENELTKNSSIVDELRLELIQSIAMIRLLLLTRWFEPADTQLYHFSTLLHQIIAVICQWGSVRADQLYNLLCHEGPFQNISPKDFKSLLIDMGNENLISQMSSGELIVGIQGEVISNHYSFFSVFVTPDEYRIIHEQKTLGSLPIDLPIQLNQSIIFAGKHWKVILCDTDKKAIFVTPAQGGTPPIYGNSSMTIHTTIREEMFNILKSGEYRLLINGQYKDFLDETARNLFMEAASFFQRTNLSEKQLFEYKGNCYVLCWIGDKGVNAIVALLRSFNLNVNAESGIIEIEKKSSDEILMVFKQILTNEIPKSEDLAHQVIQKITGKFDRFLSKELLAKEYGIKAYDIKMAFAWINQCCDNHNK